MPAKASSAVAVAAVAAAAAQNFKSEFVGVHWNKGLGRWEATIRRDGKKVQLGSFDDEQAAARAFDTAARQHAGSHAGNARRLKVNFPTAAEATFAKKKAAADAALNAKVAEEKSALKAKAVGDFRTFQISNGFSTVCSTMGESWLPKYDRIVFDMVFVRNRRRRAPTRSSSASG